MHLAPFDYISLQVAHLEEVRSLAILAKLGGRDAARIQQVPASLEE
jgi:hypothetical protein